MAASPNPKPPSFEILPQPIETPASTPLGDLARLAALHAEAEETARLANVLGRAPMTAAALVAGAGLTAALSLRTADASATIAWLVLVVIGVGAIARSYAQAIRAPFERAPLRAFAEDFRAIMLYAGFAWGAGAFLALPANAGLTGMFLFSAGMAGLASLTLRRLDTGLAFVTPVAVLAAVAALFRPEDGALTALLVLLGCGTVAGALYGAGMAGKLRALPHLPGLSAS